MSGDMSAGAPRGARPVLLRSLAVAGAVIGYGGLAAFLSLVCLQVYRWLRDGEWTRFGVNDGLRVGLTRCGVSDTGGGPLGAVLHWLESPVDWLGLHRVLEVMPASLALFALSILGNSVYIHCLDRLRAQR